MIYLPWTALVRPRSPFGAFAAAILLACLLSPAARAAQPGVTPDLTWGISHADQDREGVVLQDLGVRWVRLNVEWDAVEPSKRSYDWALIDYYDRAVAVARARGINVLMLVSRSPQWASGSQNRESPPADPRDLADFLRFLVPRWAGQVRAWEIWNEPNTERFWPGGPDPAAYTELLKAAYPAVKEADPNAKVVFGGVANLAAGSRWFVNQSYAAGAKDYFDVLGWHSYSLCGESPDVIRYWDGHPTRTSFVGYRYMHNQMFRLHDDPKPIWLTEWGWSTSSASCASDWTSGVSEQAQADYLRRGFKTLEHDPYVQVALWYGLRNNYWQNDADELEAQFGLLRDDFSPKPSYAAFKAYATSLPAR
jgi:polysaccharide biosynthesis protein PslG